MTRSPGEQLSLSLDEIFFALSKNLLKVFAAPPHGQLELGAAIKKARGTSMDGWNKVGSIAR